MDYELLTNDSGMRTVAFGKFAGYAGMINMLHGVGLQMLHLGYSSPFLVCEYVYVGESLSYKRCFIRMWDVHIRTIHWKMLPNPSEKLVIEFTNTDFQKNLDRLSLRSPETGKCLRYFILFRYLCAISIQYVGCPRSI